MYTPRTILTRVLSTLLVLVAAPCMALACPPHNIRVLAIVGIALCCFGALQFKSGLYSAWLGLVVGLLMGPLVIGFNSDAMAYAHMLPMFGSMAVILGCSCWLASWSFRRLSPWATWLFIPCMAVAMEYLALNLFPVSLALTQHTSAWACKLSSVTGQWGITWVLWFGASSLVVGAHIRNRWLLTTGLLLCAMTSLPISPMLVSTPGTVGVAAVQAPGKRTAAAITMKLPSNISFVVWPEQLQLERETTSRQTAIMARKYVVSSFVRNVKNQEPSNSARMYSPDGKEVLITDKHHLYGGEVYQYRKGVSSRAEDVGQSVRVAVPICFDLVYPDVARQLVKSGANLLMVPNSDPATPTNVFQLLHLAMVRLRAAENRVPVVWAEVNSLSSVIDGSGAVLAQAPANARTAVTAMITPGSQLSLYTRYGDWLARLCLFITVGIMGWHLILDIKRAVKWIDKLKLT
ncbi:MAG: nitrilase-related carbon-nitrogen hydrolase [Armatimonadota bacterium]